VAEMNMKIGRIEEMYLAKQICNVFLDTASLSSFAFWMGYLMPEAKLLLMKRKIFFNFAEHAKVFYP